MNKLNRKRHKTKYPGRRKKQTGYSSKFKAGIWFSSLVILTGSFYLIYRLFIIQITEHEIHAENASKVYYKQTIDYPKRGSIYESGGSELAFSSFVYDIGVTGLNTISRNDKTITKEIIAENFSEILSVDYEVVLKAINDMETPWILLKKNVEKKDADKLSEFIKKHEIGGVKFDEKEIRSYPFGKLAGNILGYVGGDATGKLGLELEYDSELTGKPGFTYVLKDNYKNESVLPFSVPVGIKKTDGLNLITSIDKNIQSIIEKELAKSIKNFNVKEGGLAIVMDPYTGSILAMTDTGGFDPNHPIQPPESISKEDWDALDNQGKTDYLAANVWRNRSISENYEPGSTFKAITAAMTMEEGKFLESEILNDRPIKVADKIIDCSLKGGHGLESLKTAFWNSCNPVFVMLSQRMGIPKFYSYVRAFGFYEPTGIDLPNEAAGIFHAKPMEIDMVCLAFGEQSTVTPIAMINAFCAFANGGTLMRPRIVKAITDSEGNIVREIPPESVRQVVSEETAYRIRNLLEGVVAYGTGNKGYVTGYHVGGKTSTSTRDDGENVISFLSMSPIYQPKICVLTVFFAPESSFARSSLAALTSARMTEQILEYLNVKRDYSEDDLEILNKKIEIPDGRGLTFAEASKLFIDKGMIVDDSDGNMKSDDKVGYQFPEPGSLLHQNSIISLFHNKDEENYKKVIVPDVRGKSINEASIAMTGAGLNLVIVNKCEGIVLSQVPEAGEEIRRWSIVEVEFGEESADNDE